MGGPRAERPELSAEYEKELPEFALRLQAKAGLTGYAQVYGKYNTTPYDKLLMDLMYIANASVLEDLKALRHIQSKFKTVDEKLAFDAIISPILYLFKDASYSYEQEYRMMFSFEKSNTQSEVERCLLTERKNRLQRQQ